MKRQLCGIAMILLSILFAITFENSGYHYLLGDISFSWQQLFMLTGIVGAIIVFLPEKKNK